MNGSILECEGVNLKVLKRPDFLCTYLFLLEIPLGIHFVPQEHLLRILRAYNARGEGLGRQPVDVVRVRMREKMK